MKHKNDLDQFVDLYLSLTEGQKRQFHWFFFCLMAKRAVKKPSLATVETAVTTFKHMIWPDVRQGLALAGLSVTAVFLWFLTVARLAQ